uniref:Si:ch211-163l21.8 n=1 Tax=Astyanax mexicanus TaxID=7994 RepID=A0A8B9LN31_ASTMX
MWSDYHFEYTDCDVQGSRWRVSIPNKPDTCTGLPDPVKGTHCTFTCNEGEYLDMKTQECQKCAAGTYSLGTGVAFDEWDSLPAGFISQGINMEFGNISTWTPKGDHIASNTDECSSTLSYAVSLKQPGSVSFQYFYPDSNIFFEFYVQNDQCQSTDSQSRWLKSSESDWDTHYVQLNSGNNILYWRTTGFSLSSNSVKPVLLKNIAISGVAYTSECFHCKPGTYSDKPGAARCAPCAADTYSNKGATVCQECEKEKYSGIGSGTCQDRPACTATDYFYTHTPCDSTGQTQLMYKWIEPKICSENAEGAVKLPASGEMQTCPPCNPGFFSDNSSVCQPCPQGSYSNGTECSECPVGTEPVVGFEYKWWNRMPGNMRSSVFSREYSDTQRSTDFFYRCIVIFFFIFLSLPQSLAKDNERAELSRITFVFETKCTADCRLFFMAVSASRNNALAESWRGTNGKQSYSYLIKSNLTVSFTWGFQRTEQGQFSDFAKIYSVHITNVIGGVAAECRQCAMDSSHKDSACVPCPPGHYMLKGTGVCKSCPSNTFIRPEQPLGEEACIPCGPNTRSNQARSACVSDCTLAVKYRGQTLQYNFSPLGNITHFQSSPRFTSKGLRYVHQFSVGLCGTEGRVLASCVDNVTDSSKEVSGYVCQSVTVPSELKGTPEIILMQFCIIYNLFYFFLGVTTESTLDHISSSEDSFPADSESDLPDVIFYYRAKETTQVCKNGRSASIRLRCDPKVTAMDQVYVPSKCSEGTCDGCSFHFLWRSQHACPLCSERNYKEIVSACIEGIQRTTYVWQQPLRCTGGVSLPAPRVSACVTLDFWLKFGVSVGTVAAVLLITISCYFWKRTRKLEYKYSKLMMNAGEKECDLPAADSCAIMEGEDAEDDLIYLTKKSFFTRIKSFSREVHWASFI